MLIESHLEQQISSEFESAVVVPTPDYVLDEIVFGAIYKLLPGSYDMGAFTKDDLTSNNCWHYITNNWRRRRNNKIINNSFVPLEVISYKVTYKKSYTTHTKNSVFNCNLVKVLSTNPDTFMTEILYLVLRDFVESYKICEEYSSEE